jgi:hypothetical protein
MTSPHKPPLEAYVRAALAGIQEVAESLLSRDLRLAARLISYTEALVDVLCEAEASAAICEMAGGEIAEE